MNNRELTIALVIGLAAYVYIQKNNKKEDIHRVNPDIMIPDKTFNLGDTGQCANNCNSKKSQNINTFSNGISILN